MKKDFKTNKNVFDKISITDKVANSMARDDSEESATARARKYEKLVMGAASAYKYSSPERKLYLPTLIKAVELDKKLKIISTKSRSGTSVRISLDKISKNTTNVDISKEERQVRF